MSISRSSLLLAAGGSALLATGAGMAPAAAQFYGSYGSYYYNVPPPAPFYGPRPYYGPDPYRAGPRPISPREVVDRLEDQGYDDVSRPRFTGTLYVLEATPPGGGPRIRVVVDAIRGVVLDRSAAGPGRSYGALEGPGAEPREAPARRSEPERRRSAGRAPADKPLPADPGLAPREGAPEPGAAAPARPPRSAARPAPAVPKAAVPPAESGSQPYGLNPSKTDQPKPVEAKKPVPSGPAAASPAGEPKPTAAQAESRPPRPVRVIEGVTPSNSGGATTAAPLDALPQPPSPAPPTNLN